jgi:hypothetical protein
VGDWNFICFSWALPHLFSMEMQNDSPIFFHDLKLCHTSKKSFFERSGDSILISTSLKQQMQVICSLQVYSQPTTAETIPNRLSSVNR